MSNRNANQMINRQIAIELDRLNSILTDEDEKPAILQRIAEFKAMLDVPSPEMQKPSQPTTRELIAELIKAIRRR